MSLATHACPVRGVGTGHHPVVAADGMLVHREVVRGGRNTRGEIEPQR
jgi:hypothetical protein